METRNNVSATDWGLFIVRLALAIIFVAHGSQKVLGLFGGPGLDQTVHMFGQMGIAAPLAYLAAFTEFLGGIAMLVGLFSRIAGVGLAITMIVAVATVHWKNGFFLGAAPGFEYNVALFAMSVAIAVAGPGRLAIADIEGRLLSKGHARVPSLGGQVTPHAR